jgi:hypothetical protein
MHQDLDWNTTTDGVFGLFQVLLECCNVQRLDGLHALMVQGFDRLVDSTARFIVALVRESITTGMSDKPSSNIMPISPSPYRLPQWQKSDEMTNRFSGSSK